MNKILNRNKLFCGYTKEIQVHIKELKFGFFKFVCCLSLYNTLKAINTNVLKLQVGKSTITQIQFTSAVFTFTLELFHDWS